MNTNQTERQSRIILFSLLFVIAVLAVVSYVRNTQNVSQTPEPTATATTTVVDAITALFNCNEKKSVTAVFTPNHVDLDLSDGRHVSLAQAISADGGRYATSDESFVFWNKGKTAFITENGTTTFDGCVTK